MNHDFCIFGDSIRMGWTPYARPILKEHGLTMVEPKGNDRGSPELMNSMEAFIRTHNPRRVFIASCGLWDLRDTTEEFPGGTVETGVGQYYRNIYAISGICKGLGVDYRWAQIPMVQDNSANFDIIPKIHLYNDAIKQMRDYLELGTLYNTPYAQRAYNVQFRDGVHWRSESEKRFGEGIAQWLVRWATG